MSCLSPGKAGYQTGALGLTHAAAELPFVGRLSAKDDRLRFQWARVKV